MKFEIIFILEMVRKSILSKKILGDLIIDFIGLEKGQSNIIKDLLDEIRILKPRKTKGGTLICF